MPRVRVAKSKPAADTSAATPSKTRERSSPSSPADKETRPDRAELVESWFPHPMLVFVRQATSRSTWETRIRLLIALIFVKLHSIDKRFTLALLQKVPPGQLCDDDSAVKFILHTFQALQEIIVAAHMQLANVWLDCTSE